MNADHFRQLYEYHRYINRKLWDTCITPLSDAQFTQDVGYSVGSIRNQLVHLMSVEERWFAGLRGVELPDHANLEHYPDRATLRAKWDAVEAEIQAYLEALDDTELGQAFTDHLQVWEVLFHVLNHATDHRAQLLAALASLGIPTFPQDYALVRMGRI
ncbi:MAG: hypothetical protein Kow0077_02010 [Anaerolineae bacterium]